MPIRGSNNKQDVPLTDPVHHISELKRDLTAIQEKLEVYQETLVDLHQVENKKGDPQTDEMMAVFARLEQRISRLEASMEVTSKELDKETEKLLYTMKQLACGGLAGAVARTTVAPIDRVKILMQTQFISSQGSNSKYTGTLQSLQTIWKEEGLQRFWRGNLTNVLRVVPYSATQFASYDFFKSYIISFSPKKAGKKDKLNNVQRLSAGALAGTAATTLTHPMDVVRLRLSTQPELKGMSDALRSVLEEGAKGLFKGYIPTVLSLAPFIAINFAAFDAMKSIVYPNSETKQNKMVILGLGAGAGLFAQTICYPLDTVRRRMQMKGQIYSSTRDAFATIIRKEGPLGLYRGMAPNAIKVVPNNAIRFLAYEVLKGWFDVKSKGGD